MFGNFMCFYELDIVINYFEWILNTQNIQESWRKDEQKKPKQDKTIQDLSIWIDR